MTTTFNLLNHAMLNQVLHELRHGRLQRCKALGLADEDIEVLQSLPPTTLSQLAHSTISWVEIKVDTTVLRRLIAQAERDELNERLINRALKLGASSSIMYRWFGLDHSETALRRRILKIETHRGRPVQLTEAQEHAVWNRWSQLREEDPENDPLDAMMMLAEEQHISLTLIWQQIELYGGAPC
ncbi:MULTISPECIES: DUF2857 domain-containing protein [unclassified Pseudomonas]|uniref:DUF2857 domain-containing protein n=1 Tax=unclassified Pseudomonas TaxID=196821 RepID=UPI000D9D6F7D|nr:MULTISPECIES: DUF2857 domain-containing protein [unclassified Pseudomonas]PYG78485.1 uncharacterized protein DUF2857 [Pseudomonas sp. RV120224-01c]PYG82573.1 uncharacterized protein DUF2857 [Pseudomonas sp. RV120224-01b]